LVLSIDASACDCFPPELRAKAAQDALQSARLAVYGRVVEVAASGKAKLLVLESFKGPSSGSAVEVMPGSGQCEVPPLAVGEEALILSFGEAATACDKHPRDHFMLEFFRANVAR
jgi:hypothetical protein